MRIWIPLVLAILLIPGVSSAAGLHESLSCSGCHGIHTAQDDIIFAVKANKTEINPLTKKPYSGVTALCLGCHTGIMPVFGKTSHPYGIAPKAKIADVPKDLLRKSMLGCVGCHDPHPSNPNYKYLRVSTGKRGSDMGQFCSLCHSSKSGTRIPASSVFSSMDETKSSARSAVKKTTRPPVKKAK
jgi:predicted CXXCH cytochrome family protein